MNLFICQVLAGSERKVVDLFETQAELSGEGDTRFHVPTRKMFLRRSGRVFQKEEVLFAGYVFVSTHLTASELLPGLRRVAGFVRMLPDNANARQLSGDALELAIKLINKGRPLDPSLVRFDENGRIRVLSGVLAGLEGRIIRVDRRKRRARVVLDLYNHSHSIDLSFTEIENADSDALAPAVPGEAIS